MLLVGSDLMVNARRVIPDVFLSLVEELSFVLVEALERGELDVALAYEVPDRLALQRVALIEEELVLVAPPGGIGQADPISLSEALDSDLVMAGERDSVPPAHARRGRRPGHRGTRGLRGAVGAGDEEPGAARRRREHHALRLRRRGAANGPGRHPPDRPAHSAHALSRQAGEARAAAQRGRRRRLPPQHREASSRSTGPARPAAVGPALGSQGDGTAQFLARSAADQQAIMEIIERDLGMECLQLTLRPSRYVREQVRPRSRLRDAPFSRFQATKKELFPIVDRDGIAKPAILLIVPG